MFCVQLAAKPTKRTADYRKATGAYVNCWINFRERHGAVLLAKKYVADNKWELSRAKPVLNNFSCLSDVPRQSRKFYSEALKYGYSLVFYCWRTNSEKAKQSKISVSTLQR